MRKIRDVQKRKQMINDLIRDYIVLPVCMLIVPGMIFIYAILH